MLQNVDHTGIIVTDMDRSLAWYTTVLGLKLRARVKLGETTELAFLTCGATELELVCRKGAPLPAKEGRVNHLAFTVADVGQVLSHLRSHGVDLLDQEPRYLPALKSYIAFFNGPDGELFELVAHDPVGASGT
jgi:lactoylglutathione lyase